MTPTSAASESEGRVTPIWFPMAVRVSLTSGSSTWPGPPALGSTRPITALTNAPIDSPRLLPPCALATELVEIGETASASIAIELTVVLRASWAVTISRSTPTAIAAPTRAEPLAASAVRRRRDRRAAVCIDRQRPGDDQCRWRRHDFRNRLVSRECGSNGRGRSRGRNVLRQPRYE